MKRLLIACVLLLSMNTTVNAITLKTKCTITDKNGIAKSIQSIKLNPGEYFSLKRGEFTFDISFNENNQKEDFNITIKKTIKS